MTLLLVAVAAASGLCLADAHAADGHHDHGGGAALDLCIGMIGVALVSAPPIVLAVVGHASLPAYLAVGPSALDVLELPPKR
jgi:hypothetical protein